jgi:hypothetical protein
MYHSSDYISIHEVNKRLTFKKGLYHLDVIGGWEIERNGFRMKLAHENGEDSVFPILPWSVQNMFGWKKGKRVFDFQIQKDGIYTLHFFSPDVPNCLNNYTSS